MKCSSSSDDTIRVVNLEQALSLMFNPFRRLIVERIVFHDKSIDVYARDDEDLHTVTFEPKIGVANIQDLECEAPLKDLDIGVSFDENGQIIKALWIKAYFL